MNVKNVLQWSEYVEYIYGVDWAEMRNKLSKIYWKGNKVYLNIWLKVIKIKEGKFKYKPIGKWIINMNDEKEK